MIFIERLITRNYHLMIFISPCPSHLQLEPVPRSHATPNAATADLVNPDQRTQVTPEGHLIRLSYPHQYCSYTIISLELALEWDRAYLIEFSLVLSVPWSVLVPGTVADQRKKHVLALCYWRNGHSWPRRTLHRRFLYLVVVALGSGRGEICESD